MLLYEEGSDSASRSFNDFRFDEDDDPLPVVEFGGVNNWDGVVCREEGGD